MELSRKLLLLSFALLSLGTSCRGENKQEILSKSSNQGTQSDWLVAVGQVTGVFSSLNGFFIQQSELSNSEKNPTSATAIFVESTIKVIAGQRVKVEGQTAEDERGIKRFLDGATVVLLENGAKFPLPAPVPLVLPIPSEKDKPNYLAKLNGMLVVLPTRLFVVDNHALGQHGEVTLSPQPRQFTPTNSVDPNDPDAAGTASGGSENVEAIHKAAEANLASRIILDDGSNTSPPAKVPFLRSGGTEGDTLRIGDSVEGVTGILCYNHHSFRIEPTASIVFEATNPREPKPADVGGRIKIAGANVLNYFTTFGGKDDRGADGPQELERQRAKIVAGLLALDADVVALCELQNNGISEGSAAFDLIFGKAGLNAALEARHLEPYTIVPPPSVPFGGDAIQVGMIYRAGKVKPVSGSVTDEAANLPIYSRPPLAQLFATADGGSKFWVIANHFKSKGSGKNAPMADRDQQDGQGAFNAKRKAQASALISFIKRSIVPVEPKVLVMGDLNSYGEEDPVDMFRAAGYVDLLAANGDHEQPYSFLFDGQLGRLDHALATPALAKFLTGALEWHVNSVEPHIIDYNLDTDDGKKSPMKPDDRFTATPYRYSDHDPVLLGFDLPASESKETSTNVPAQKTLLSPKARAALAP